MATTAPAAASLPGPAQLDVDPAALLAAVHEAPASTPAAAEPIRFALFEEPPGDRFELLDPATLEHVAFTGRPPQPHLFPELETRLRATDFSGWGQPQGIQWFEWEIAAGGHVGPNLYAYVSNDPVNFEDPLGLERLIIPAGMTVEEAESLRREDPAEFQRVTEEERTRRGPRFRRKYEGTYDFFKSIPEGAEAARELEERSERLYIRFDPEQKGPLLVSEYVWREGRMVAASLTVGPNWTENITDAVNYPFGSTLLPGRKLRLYKLAHEEQGHFVLALSDSRYLDLLQAQENYRALVDMAIGKVERLFPGRRDIPMRAAAQRLIPDQLKRDALERKGTMERAADEEGKRFVLFFEEGQR